jgi:nitroreductase
VSAVTASPLAAAVSARRSYSRVTPDAPTRADLLPLVALAAQVADHGALRPWRLIELRGEARERLGEALAAASGHTGTDRARLAAKPLRAELLIAVVACRRESHKVADWEQDAAAAGVAHALSLLLDDAGWGVMWRTGPHTRSAPVRDMHGLTGTEELLGWLYVGGVPADAKPAPRPPFDPANFLTAL